MLPSGFGTHGYKSHKKLAGKIRMIPSHMVMTLDIITEKKEKSKPDEDSLERSYI